MDKILIIDLEATCGDSVPRDEMEIIEVGMVVCDLAGNEYDRFQMFSKPVRHTTLTDFCKTLTGINQDQVDFAEDWDFVADRISAFISRHDITIWGSWGDYDKNQIRKDCVFKGVDNPFKELEHFNLKDLFAKQNGLKKQVGLSKAIQLKGLTFDGDPHHALIDAENTAKLITFITIPRDYT